MRGLFSAGLAGCIYLFEIQYSNYGYLLAVLLITIAVLTVTQFKVVNGDCTIIKYYFFGLIPVKTKFQKENIIRINSFDVELDQDHSAVDTDSGWDILTIFLPAPKVTLTKVLIVYEDFFGEEKRLRVRLSAKEIEMLRA